MKNALLGKTEERVSCYNYVVEQGDVQGGKSLADGRGVLNVGSARFRRA